MIFGWISFHSVCQITPGFHPIFIFSSSISRMTVIHHLQGAPPLSKSQNIIHLKRINSGSSLAQSRMFCYISYMTLVFNVISLISPCFPDVFLNVFTSPVFLELLNIKSFLSDQTATPQMNGWLSSSRWLSIRSKSLSIFFLLLNFL